MDWSRFNPQPDPETKKNYAGDDWSRFKPVPAPSPTPPRGEPKRLPPAIELRPTGRVHDGDTYYAQGGQNVRLGNVDAFELGQQGRSGSGSRYPLGVLSRNSLASFATPEASARSNGTESYGRPVASLTAGGRDVGRDMVRRGMAIPDPRFIPANSLGDYVSDQRGAIASEAGAYSGQYQFPWDYRAQGEAAQWRGRAPMSPEDAASWEALLRDPKTEREDVERWLTQRGHKAENLDNIMSLVRRNQATQPRPVFQQEDIQGNPVQRVQPFWKRQGAAVAEGVPDVLGTPAEGLSQGVFGPGGMIAKVALDRSGISLPDSATREGDNVVLRWKPRTQRQPLPPGYEGTVKAREGVGPMRPDEIGMFADSFDKPRTSIRLEPEQEDEIGAALLAGDGRKAMQLARQYGIALDPASVRRTVAAAQKLRASGRTPRFAKGQGPLSYAVPDKMLREDEAANVQASQPAFGTEDIRQFMHGVTGIGQLDESYAPQSTAERYLQAVERSIPGAVIPIAGERALLGNVSRQALATGFGGSAGTYIGAQAADDVAPGNQLVSLLAQGIGGGMAGVGSRKLATPRAREPIAKPAPETASEPQLPATMAMEAEIPPGPSIAAPVEQPVKGPGGRNAVTPETADALGTVTPEEVLPGPVGDQPPTMAGNIKLANLESPQDIRQALNTVSERAGGFEEARRGKITHDETIALAEDLGMTARQLLGRRKGEAFNAEQALAARQLLAKSGNEIVNDARRLSERIAAGTASDADMVAFRQKLNAHAAIQQEVAGMTAEAGRTLSQFRIPADSRMVRGDVLKSLIDQAGGPEGIRKIAETIIDNADDPKRMNLITRTLARPNLRDKFIELYYNFLLSGPRTHAVNVTSNIMTSMLQTPEHLAAAAIGSPRALIRKGADRVLFSEAGARITGMMQGAREGMKEFAKTLKTGEPSDAMSKVEATTHRAIGGPAGSVLRTPTRLLMAEDELFKAVARRMETVGLAVRQAGKEGLRGAEAKTRAAELAANPTPEMLERAAAYGRYLTFQTPLGPAGQAVLNLTNRAPGLKLFIPFVRTPLNILKFAIERSPGAPFLSEWRADIKAGGARRDLALARVSLGTGAAMLAVEAARNGLLTGSGPADEKARNVWLAAGNQPYSVKIGDKFYSYQRLDPLSTTLGLAADYVGLQEQMTDKQRDSVAATIATSALQNLSSKTWLSGMTDLAQALDDPGRYFENTFTRLGASIATPTLSSQVAAAVDPVMRDGQGLAARIQSRIPGMSDELPARLDVFGNPIETGNGGGLAAFSPIYTGERANDPLINTLSSAGVGISRPKRGDFDPKQYGQYQIRSAAIFKPELQALVEDPEWQTMAPDERQHEVDRIVARARKEAKQDVLLGQPDGQMPAADPWARFKPTKAQ